MAKNKITLDIQTPRVFLPLLQPSRYKGCHGGRGSGKSMFFAELMIEEALSNPGYKAVCIREVQKSIQFSVKELLVEKIKKFGVERMFDVQDKIIKTPGGGLIIFQGMQSHNSDSIKSLQGFDRFWAEEASALSTVSLRKLRPTLRARNSQFWASWNPESPKDAIDEFLRSPSIEGNKDFCVVKANWQDNPWFPQELELERQIDLKRNKDDYAHIWEGAYLSRSDALVFKNWSVEEFDSPEDAVYLYGADFGYKDPATLVRLRVDDKARKIYIDHEAYKVNCPIDKLPDLYKTVPGAERGSIRADSSRPDTIRYLRENGFPKIVPSTKGPNSIKEGVEFLQSYDIVIHKRCKYTIQEFSMYKYKIDPKTEEILNEFEDKENHILDPARYAIEIIRKNGMKGGGVSFHAPQLL